MKWMKGLAAAVLLAGCAEAVGPEGLSHVPGALVVAGWTSSVPLNAGTGGNVSWSPSLAAGDIGPAEVIVAPDTVTAGQPFEVVTQTIGLNGCWRSDGQAVQVWAEIATLRPYDSHSGSEVCTGALVMIAHASTLVLPSPGTWTLRVEGRKLRSGDRTWYEPVSAERSIHVR